MFKLLTYLSFFFFLILENVEHILNKTIGWTSPRYPSPSFNYYQFTANFFHLYPHPFPFSILSWSKSQILYYFIQYFDLYIVDETLNLFRLLEAWFRGAISNIWFHSWISVREPHPQSLSTLCSPACIWWGIICSLLHIFCLLPLHCKPHEKKKRLIYLLMAAFPTSNTVPSI